MQRREQHIRLQLFAILHQVVNCICHGGRLCYDWFGPLHQHLGTQSQSLTECELYCDAEHNDKPAFELAWFGSTLPLQCMLCLFTWGVAITMACRAQVIT